MNISSSSSGSWIVLFRRSADVSLKALKRNSSINCAAGHFLPE